MSCSTAISVRGRKVIEPAKPRWCCAMPIAMVGATSAPAASPTPGAITSAQIAAVPMRPIGPDAICAEVIARGVGEAAGALVAPTIAIGMAQHHLGFAGSITLRPRTLIAVLQDIVESLVKHGFERFYFINGHGGNIATMAAAFSEIYAARSLV